MIQNKLDDLKDKGKTFVENLEEKRHELIQKWEDKSREFINNFLELFGREGRIVCLLNLTKSMLNSDFQFQNDLWSRSTGRIKRALSPAPSPSGSPCPSPSHSNGNGDTPPKAKHRRSYSPILEHNQFSDDESSDDETVKYFTPTHKRSLEEIQ